MARQHFGTKKGEEAILINWDQFESAFGQDFTDCVPFEIEHEAEELWLTRGKERVDSFGPDHYEAIRAAMKKADSEGKVGQIYGIKTSTNENVRCYGGHACNERIGVLFSSCRTTQREIVYASIYFLGRIVISAKHGVKSWRWNSRFG